MSSNNEINFKISTTSMCDIRPSNVLMGIKQRGKREKKEIKS